MLGMLNLLKEYLVLVCYLFYYIVDKYIVCLENLINIL